MNTELLSPISPLPPSYYSHDFSIIKNPLNIIIEEKIQSDGEDIDEFDRFCLKWGFDSYLPESYEVFKLRSKEY